MPSTSPSVDGLLAILDAMDSGVYVADLVTHEILFANASLRRMFGEILGRVCWQALQAGQTGRCDFCTNASLLDEAGEPTEGVVWHHYNPLARVWLEVRDRAIRWTDGRMVRLSISTDATDQRAEVTSLHESESTLRDITSLLGDGILVVDARGRSTFVNPKAEALLGWSAEELLGTDLHARIHEARLDGCTRPREACPTTRVLTTGIPDAAHEEFFRRKDGTFLPVAFVVTPIHQKGRVNGAVLVFHDITARQAAIADQAKLITQLREALARVNMLSGLLPICAWCKRIRDDQGYWQQVEVYLHAHADVSFTHGICADCAEHVHGEPHETPVTPAP